MFKYVYIPIWIHIQVYLFVNFSELLFEIYCIGSLRKRFHNSLEPDSNSFLNLTNQQNRFIIPYKPTYIQCFLIFPCIKYHNLSQNILSSNLIYWYGLVSRSRTIVIRGIHEDFSHKSEKKGFRYHNPRHCDTRLDSSENATWLKELY